MLSRRNLLLAMPALLLLPRDAAAYSECSEYNSEGTKTCTVGVKIGDVETVRQRCIQWCWAACIETIFRVHGHLVHQEYIVEKIYGSEDACEPANAAQVRRAIDGKWYDATGELFYASAEQLPTLGPASWGGDGVQEIIEELSEDRPLINGALGHATVLTAVTYEQSKYFNPKLREIIVRDPWPDNPNRRALEIQEIAGSFFVIKVEVD